MRRLRLTALLVLTGYGSVVLAGCGAMEPKASDGAVGDRGGFGEEPGWGGLVDYGDVRLGTDDAGGDAAACQATGDTTVEIGPPDDPFTAWEEGDDIEVLYGSEGGGSLSLTVRTLGTPATFVVTATVSVDEDGEVIAAYEAASVDAQCDDAGYHRVTLSLPVVTEKAEFQLIAAPATVTLDVAFETLGGDSTQFTVTHKGGLVL